MEPAREAILSLWERFIYIPDTQFPGQNIPLGALQFVQSLVSFALLPCLLFFGAYYLMRKVSLDDDLPSIAASLFMGGGIGSLLSVLPFLIVFLGADFSGYLQQLTSEFGFGWNLGSLVVNFMNEGLYSVFVGVSAAYFVSYRRRNPATAEADRRPDDVEGEAVAATV